MSAHPKLSQAGVTTFDYDGTDVAFFLPDREDHIQKTIARDKTFYERDMLDDIRDRAVPGTLAIDVGANIGNHTVFFGKVCHLDVIAIEPSPHCYEILTRNIDLNNLRDRVIALPKAAGQAPGSGRIVEPNRENLGQTRVEKDVDGAVEIVPLDSLTLPSHVSLLKIDVEGMELEVLKGASGLIRRFSPLIYVEAQDDDLLKSIRALLATFAYRVVAEFNWTPTFLFAPCGTPQQQFDVIMTRLDRIEREAGGGGNRRWKALAEDLGAKREQLLCDVERWRSAAEELKEKRHEALDDAKRWQAVANDLRAKREEFLRDMERWKATAEKTDEDRRKALEDAAQSARHLQGRIDKLDKALGDKKSECASLSEQVKQLRLRSEKLSRDVQNLSARSDRHQQELTHVYGSKRYRIGDAIVQAARPSRDTLRLPVRLWWIYRGPRCLPPDWSRVTAAAPGKRDAAAERLREFKRDFETFAARVVDGDFSHLVVNFGGTTYIQDIRANRPIRLTRSFARMGIPVLFNFHRWRESDHIPPYDNGLVFQSPIDQTPGLVQELVRRDLGRTRGVFVVSYPHPSVCPLINLANANGWVTLYDCRDDWEEFEKVGMAKWYEPAVEKFVVNNCDFACCVSRTLQSKLSGFTTTRPVLLSPNAYDPAFLADGYERRPGSETKVGYFGHLTERWFDWDSLLWVARQRPDYHFEIIGHGAPEGLDLPPNVKLFGPKPHAEICEIAARWHVAIIPFRASRLADGVDPIKIYEYFGLGLPVVSFRMPQIAEYPRTTTVDTREAFVEALDQAIKREPDPQVFKDFLEKNTWDHRAREMLAWADEAFDRATCEKTFNLAATAAGKP